jgi:hypothetical protein
MVLSCSDRLAARAAAQCRSVRGRNARSCLTRGNESSIEILCTGLCNPEVWWTNRVDVWWPYIHVSWPRRSPLAPRSAHARL